VFWVVDASTVMVELEARTPTEIPPVGTALLLATVIGSSIMGEKLAGGNVAIALLLQRRPWRDPPRDAIVTHRAA
jgi:hypothetical protein